MVTLNFVSLQPLLAFVHQPLGLKFVNRCMAGWHVEVIVCFRSSQQLRLHWWWNVWMEWQQLKSCRHGGVVRSWITLVLVNGAICTASMPGWCVEGLFQADPHPGNIMSLKETEDAICLLDFGQCCEVTPQQQILFHSFAVGAPTSEFEANNQERNLKWLKSLGIEVYTPEPAQAAANLLFFGQKNPMFPDTKAIDPELTPLLLLGFVIQSRFENKVVETAQGCWFWGWSQPFCSSWGPSATRLLPSYSPRWRVFRWNLFNLVAALSQKFKDKAATIWPEAGRLDG